MPLTFSIFCELCSPSWATYLLLCVSSCRKHIIASEKHLIPCGQEYVHTYTLPSSHTSWSIVHQAVLNNVKLMWVTTDVNPGEAICEDYLQRVLCTYKYKYIWIFTFYCRPRIHAFTFVYLPVFPWVAPMHIRIYFVSAFTLCYCVIVLLMCSMPNFNIVYKTRTTQWCSQTQAY